MSKNRNCKKNLSEGKGRLLALSLFIQCLFVIAVVRAIHLQVYKAPDLRQRAEEQRLRRVELLPRRGTIYDRNERVLAKNILGASIYVDPALFGDSEIEINNLANALALDREEVKNRLNSGSSRFAWLKRAVSPKEEAAVAALNLKSVGIVKEPRRYYPRGLLAGQLLGFVDSEGKGLGGLEYKYDSVLSGRPQTVIAERDAMGRLLLGEAPDLEGVKGGGIVLSLDETIQSIAEEELARTIERSGAKGGLAVAMDPSTGEILAMAQIPYFNPNALSASTSEDRKIKALVDVYEPGSTMKALFLGVLMDKGLAEPDEKVFCENGSWNVHRRTIHDHHGYGMLSVGEILKFSSNIGVAKLSERISPTALYEGFRKFGLGEKTEIGIAGESKGILPPVSLWSKMTPITIAYGQGVSATALQVTAAFSALANKGVLMKPILVKKVLDENATVVERNDPEALGRAVSEKTAAALVPLLEQVVQGEGGTGSLAAVDGYSTAGKTGTSWKPDLVNGGYMRDKWISSFVGFAPSRSPRITILAAIDEPTKGSRYGGSVAGPAFSKMAARILSYLGVPPDEKVEEKSYAAAKPLRSDKEPAPSGTMPDLSGLTMREALRELDKRGVEVLPTLMGSGIAAMQDPPPGVKLHPWDECRIVFKPVL